MIMLLLDFCNIREWSVEKISTLYESHKIIHTKYGESRGWEHFCRTKNSEKHYYFKPEDIPEPPEDMPQENRDKAQAFFVLPTQPEYPELWEMLEKSQFEHRTFLDECRDGKLNLEFINNLMKLHFIHSTSGMFPIYFSASQINKWLPDILYDQYYLQTIESYIAWEIFEISLGRIKAPSEMKSSVLECISRCEWCENHFLYKRETRRFCSTKCRLDYNYKKDMATGTRQEYARQWRRENINNI